MNTTNNPGAGLASRGGRQVTLVLLFIFLALMIGIYYWTGVQTAHDQEYIELLGQQQVLSQQISKDATEAANGLPDAFSLLKESRDKFVKNLGRLKNGDAATGLPPFSRKLSKERQGLETLWLDTEEHVQAILNVMQPITTLYDFVAQFDSHAVETVLETDELVNLMVETGAPAEQIYVATRELMLMERISNNIRATLRGGEGAITAADRFGRDAILFEQVIKGLLEGSPQLGISQITDPESKEILDRIASRLGQQNSLINKILENSIELFRIQEASSTISINSDGLLKQSSNLLEKYEEERNSRLISGKLTIVFGVATLLMLLLLGWMMTREQRKAAELSRLRAEEARVSEEEARRREQQTRDTNQRNQEAILRLLGEISDLADGDLTVMATVSEEFTGAIADAINYSVEEMRGLVTNINETSAQVADATRGATNLATEMGAASERQAREIETITGSVNEMAFAFKEVSESAASSSEVAQQSVSIASKGGQAVRDTIEGMGSLRETIQETSKRIKRLGESSQEIGDIIGLIDDIADQTSILALNAAIQASMAGEAGRGFAVVADEVQRLAERSSQATRQIEMLVKTIQSDTNDAVISMEQSTSDVVEGAQLAESAGEALGEIEAVSTELASLVQGISTSSQEQADQAEKVSKAMNSIRTTTLQTTEDTRKTADSVGHLSMLAEELSRSVAGFKLPGSAFSGHEALPEATEMSSDHESMPGANEMILGHGPEPSDIETIGPAAGGLGAWVQPR